MPSDVGASEVASLAHANAPHGKVPAERLFGCAAGYPIPGDPADADVGSKQTDGA